MGARPRRRQPAPSSAPWPAGFSSRAHGGADRDDLASFIDRATGGRLDTDWARFVLSDVVAGPKAVLDLWRNGRRSVVAVCVDNLEAQGNAAEVSLFANARRDLTALDGVVAWALARCRAAGRSNLDIPLWPATLLDPGLVRSAGFELHHVMYDMTRDQGAAPARPAADSLAPGFEWRRATVELSRAYHDTVSLAFADLPGAFVPPFEDMARRLAETTSPPWLLLGPDPAALCAGYVRVRRRDDGVGEIASLGRHPLYRGRGLGPHLLARGVEELAELGCTELTLEVAAQNADGLALYEGFGFRIAHRTPVFRRPVRT